MASREQVCAGVDVQPVIAAISACRQKKLEMQREEWHTNAEEESARPSLSLVGIAGIPGSGKSTVAAAIVADIGSGAIALPMDGFHYPLQRLREFPDAAAAVYRRGAPDTFDRAGFVAKLRELRNLGELQAADRGHEWNNETGTLLRSITDSTTVSWPGFDHHVGDPVANALTVRQGKHTVAIVEGIYVLLWPEAAALFDVRVFLDADVEVCCSCRLHKYPPSLTQTHSALADLT